MTDKRFVLDNEYDDESEYFYDNIEEIAYYFCEHEDFYDVVNKLNQLHEENQQLKKDIDQFSNWKIELSSPQRKNIDKILKMSVLEILEAFEYYKKRIRDLEKEIE